MTNKSVTSTKTLGEVAANLATAIADFIERKETPEFLRDSLDEWYVEALNRYGQDTGPAIRRNFVAIVETAAMEETWPSEISL